MAAGRSVRDLRELICVSRLTFCDSDDDDDDGDFRGSRFGNGSDNDDVITAVGSDLEHGVHDLDSLMSSSSSLDLSQDEDSASEGSQDKLTTENSNQKPPKTHIRTFDDASSGFFSSAGSNRRHDVPTQTPNILVHGNAASGSVSAPSLRSSKSSPQVIVRPRPPTSPRPPSTGSGQSCPSVYSRNSRVKLSPLKSLDDFKENMTTEKALPSPDITSPIRDRWSGSGDRKVVTSLLHEPNDVRESVKLNPFKPLPPLSKDLEVSLGDKEYVSKEAKKKKRKKKKKKKTHPNDSTISFVSPRNGHDSSSCDETNACRNTVPKKLRENKRKPDVKVPSNADINLVLDYIDSTVVSDWLTRANDMLQILSVWSQTKDNFVQFANFWLSSFTDTDSQQLIELEFSIIMDEMRIAFKSGLSSGRVKNSHIQNLLQATFSEYPNKLFGVNYGRTNFLNILQVLSCQSSDAYFELLTNVKYRTQNSVYAQWILSLRSFTLINIWSNVIKFFENLHQNGNASNPISTRLKGKETEEASIDQISIQR